MDKDVDQIIPDVAEEEACEHEDVYTTDSWLPEDLVEIDACTDDFLSNLFQDTISELDGEAYLVTEAAEPTIYECAEEYEEDEEGMPEATLWNQESDEKMYDLSEEVVTVEEEEAPQLPIAALLAPPTRPKMSRRFVPQSPEAPVPEEPFPFDCLPQEPVVSSSLDEVSTLLKDSSRVRAAMPTAPFGRLVCRPAGMVVQQILNPPTVCRLGLWTTPDVFAISETLSPEHAASVIQKAFRNFTVAKLRTRFALELGATKPSAEPVAQAQPATPGLCVQRPAEPMAGTRRPRGRVMPASEARAPVAHPPSEAAAPEDDMKLQEQLQPQPPAPATPKTPGRRRRPMAQPTLAASDATTYRMDTDTEDAPSKAACEELAKDFSALGAEVYNLNKPSSADRPRPSPRKRNVAKVVQAAPKLSTDQKAPEVAPASNDKPVSAMLLDLAGDMKMEFPNRAEMCEARIESERKHRECFEAVYNGAVHPNFLIGSPKVTKHSPRNSAGKSMLLPEIPVAHSKAFVACGKLMADNVSARGSLSARNHRVSYF